MLWLIAVVQRLLKKDDIEVNAANNSGDNPLLVAAYYGHLAVVQRLLEEEGIEVNAANNNGTTPLLVAAQEGHLAVVQRLLEEEGIEVNASRNNGTTPLYTAALKGHVNIGAILLINGANFDNVDTEFYKKAIENIACGIIDYDVYTQKELAFAMGSHNRLGEESRVLMIDSLMIPKITKQYKPPIIELDKMQPQHRNAVQESINKLQQEQNTPASYFDARVSNLISQNYRQM